MLWHLDREGYRKPFVVHGHDKIASGLYKFWGGRRGKRKVLVLQLFKKRTRVRRRPWMTTATNWALKKRPPGRTFAHHADKVTNL